MKIKFLMVACLTFITGCARYKAKQLPAPQTTTTTVVKEKSIAISCRTLSKQDCKSYLGRDVMAKGYTAIQVTILNSTDRYLKVSQSNISLKTIPAEIVADNVKFSPVKRLASWGVGGLFFPVLFIPAIIDPIRAHEANQELVSDYTAKSVQDKIIPPYSEITGIVFVATDDYRRSFTITLADMKSHENIICKAIC